MRLSVSVVSPTGVLYEGQAASVVVPGEAGVFEVLPFHHRIVSRLLSGTVFVDSIKFHIRRGIVKAAQNTVTVIVEEAG